VFFPQQEFSKKYRNENFLPLEHGFQSSEQTPAIWRLLGTASNGVGYLRLPAEYRSKVSRVATSFEKFLVENSSGRGLETSERWMVPGRGSYVKDHKRAAERRVRLIVPSVLADLVLSGLSHPGITGNGRFVTNSAIFFAIDF